MRHDTVVFGNMRRCSACRRVKHIDNFSPKKKGVGPFDRHYTCRACNNQRAKAWYSKNRERAMAKTGEWAQMLRRQAINAICNGQVECKCCGERRFTMLDIDHVNGGGYKHLKANGSNRMYRDMIASPNGYQLLCCNCNQSKRRNGGFCEHKTQSMAESILCA